MPDALVLAGAVAKGAFTAGALSALTEPATRARLGLDVVRIVGTSSGALNGAFYAAAIRAGTQASAGARLVQLWLDDATVRGAFQFSLRDLARGRGLSNDRRILEVLRQQIHPTAGRNPIELRLVLTNADGEAAVIDGARVTTFEHVVRLSGEDFDTQAALERVFVAVAASAALPVVYAPVALELRGRAVHGLDGGLVDDTALGHALEGATAITRAFVIAPLPLVHAPVPNLRGLALASRVIDIVVDQPLVRDLRRAARVNRVLAELPSLVADPAERAAVIEALGWTGRRQVQIVEIRPDAELPGNALSGFASRDLRAQYVRAGVVAARRAVEAILDSR